MVKPRPPGTAGQIARGFWDYSLRLYAMPGVAPSCIALQDRDGLDVNLLLLCCFAWRDGWGALPAPDLAAAESIVAPWRRQVVEPLRMARRRLRAELDAGAPVAAMRRRAASLELAAEREAQRRLAAWLAARPYPNLAPRQSDLAAALDACAAMAAGPLSQATRRDLARLRRAALAAPEMQHGLAGF